jgi:hypothetical protein
LLCLILWIRSKGVFRAREHGDNSLSKKRLFPGKKSCIFNISTSSFVGSLDPSVFIMGAL